MRLSDRLALKCLAQASRQLSIAVSEGLCGEPDRMLVLRLVRDARALLEEFHDAYPERLE